MANAGVREGLQGDHDPVGQFAVEPILVEEGAPQGQWRRVAVGQAEILIPCPKGTVVQRDAEMCDDLIFFGVDLEELGLRIELGQLLRDARLLLAVGFDRAFEVGFPAQMLEQPLVMPVLIVPLALRAPGRSVTLKGVAI